jgi:cytidyltransferase-like protein
MRNDKLITFKQARKLSEGLKSAGKRTVFVHGFFDLIHIGHIKLFAEAKKRGDTLFVGVDSKFNSKILKRKRSILNSDKDRAFVISSVCYVDYCFVLPSMSKSEKLTEDKPVFYVDVYKKLQPDVVVSCMATDREGGLLRKQQAYSAGIKFINIKLRSRVSTSKMVIFFGLN